MYKQRQNRNMRQRRRVMLTTVWKDDSSDAARDSVIGCRRAQ